MGGMASRTLELTVKCLVLLETALVVDNEQQGGFRTADMFTAEVVVKTTKKLCCLV